MTGMFVPSLALEPYRFDVISQQWKLSKGFAKGFAKGSANGFAAGSLSIVSWNVWFSEVEKLSRAQELFRVLETLRPDVVCLQEVMPDFLGWMLEKSFVREHYCCSDPRGVSFSDYGAVMLVRSNIKAFRLHELSTSMGRSLVTADIPLGTSFVRVGTVHLESMRHNTAMRVEQLRQIESVLLSSDFTSVLTGDFNFDPRTHSEEQSALDRRWCDTWPALHPADPGYTVDSQRNAMLAVIAEDSSKRRRYDRLLLHSHDHKTLATEIQLLGTSAFATKTVSLFPSDHFGLSVRLERKE